MDKVMVRHLVQPGKSEVRSRLDLTYEVDPFNRELLSHILEFELESSLDELEKSLEKDSKLLEI